LNPEALSAAFAALTNYEPGSSRGALVPIEEATRAALADPAATVACEGRLVEAFNTATPAGREFLCRQLALVGTARSVRVLAAHLDDTRLGEAARAALEAISIPEAADALRQRLPELDGRARVGVISSLGMRRDGASVPLLARWLTEEDPALTSAAAAALGQIGDEPAARALARFAPQAPAALLPALGDALLTCAEGLQAAGKVAPARRLLGLLTESRWPDPVRQAAARLEFPQLVFEDTFEGRLAEGWRWLREHEGSWRIADRGLEIRVEPGMADTVRNALVRPAPDRTRGAYAIDVMVRNLTGPTEQFEQAGMTWYSNGTPAFKLVKELVDGELMIIPGRKPMAREAVQLRLVVTRDAYVAQFRPDGQGEFQTAETGTLPPARREEISIECYHGPAAAEHWIRFTDFRVTRLEPRP
jgi:hypothetical protein